MRRLSRRQLLASGVRELLPALALSSLLGACRENEKRAGRTSDRQLNLYAWADYFAPNVIPDFEREHGVRVVYDTFASNEQLLAKLQAGATEYDIIMPSSYMLQQLIRLELVAPLDHERIPALRNIMPRFLDPAYDRHLLHSVPQFWGSTGIAYDSRLFSANGSPPDDWEWFWQPKFAGRLTLLDDARETIGMALKRMGESYNCVDVTKIQLATAALIAEKPLVMCYTSDQVIVQLAAGDSLLAMVYSGDAFQAQKSNSWVRYVIPRQGTSIWLDSFCLLKSAPHPDIAYQWLNYMLRPAVSAASAQFNRFATANKQALAYLSPEERNEPGRYPSESVLAKCEELHDIGSRVAVYDRQWTELKCS